MSVHRRLCGESGTPPVHYALALLYVLLRPAGEEQAAQLAQIAQPAKAAGLTANVAAARILGLAERGAWFLAEAVEDNNEMAEAAAAQAAAFAGLASQVVNDMALRPLLFDPDKPRFRRAWATASAVIKGLEAHISVAVSMRGPADLGLPPLA